MSIMSIMSDGDFDDVEDDQPSHLESNVGISDQVMEALASVHTLTSTVIQELEKKTDLVSAIDVDYQKAKQDIEEQVDIQKDLQKEIDKLKNDLKVQQDVNTMLAKKAKASEDEYLELGTIVAELAESNEEFAQLLANR